MSNMMNADAVGEILTTLEEASVRIWLDGGWGVDALLGEPGTQERTRGASARHSNPRLRVGLVCTYFAASSFGLHF